MLTFVNILAPRPCRPAILPQAADAAAKRTGTPMPTAPIDHHLNLVSQNVMTAASWVLTAVLLVGLILLETYLFRDARREVRRHDHVAVADS